MCFVSLQHSKYSRKKYDTTRNFLNKNKLKIFVFCIEHNFKYKSWRWMWNWCVWNSFFLGVMPTLCSLLSAISSASKSKIDLWSWLWFFVVFGKFIGSRKVSLVWFWVLIYSQFFTGLIWVFPTHSNSFFFSIIFCMASSLKWFWDFNPNAIPHYQK